MQVIAGIAVIGLLGGLLYALWAVIRRSRRRTRRIAEQLGRGIEPTSTRLIVRRNRKATAAFTLFFAYLAALGISQGLASGSSGGTVFGLVAALLSALALRLTMDRAPVLVLDGHGFETRKAGLIPWDTVDEVRLEGWKGYVTHYELCFKLKEDARLDEDVTVPLDWLSPRWNDIVEGVQDRFGQRVSVGRVPLSG